MYERVLKWKGYTNLILKQEICFGLFKTFTWLLSGKNFEISATYFTLFFK